MICAVVVCSVLADELFTRLVGIFYKLPLRLFLGTEMIFDNADSFLYLVVVVHTIFTSHFQSFLPHNEDTIHLNHLLPIHHTKGLYDILNIHTTNKIYIQLSANALSVLLICWGNLISCHLRMPVCHSTPYYVCNHHNNSYFHLN